MIPTPVKAITPHCVSDETVLDPLFAAVSRPFRTVFRGLGAGFWNLLDKTEKTAKNWEKNEVKWARNGLKKVGPMTDSWETHGTRRVERGAQCGEGLLQRRRGGEVEREGRAQAQHLPKPANFGQNAVRISVNFAKL